MSEPEMVVRADGAGTTLRNRRSPAPAWTSPPFDLELRAGELVAITGPTHAGKSTVIHLLAGWLAASAGRIEWPGAPAEPPPWSYLTVVPQPLALLDELTVIENIEFSARAARAGGLPSERTDELLERLDLARLRDRGIGQVSIGERQRVMVARALVGQARVVLADEPVAHQDERRAEAVLALLAEAAESGTACVIATREPAIAARAHRIITLGSWAAAGSATG